MIMVLLYPLVLCVALAIWTASAVRARSVVAPRREAAVVLGLALAYGAGLGLVSAYPYFEDNGMPEFIGWPERWSWAAEYAGWVALLLVPAALGIDAVLRRGISGTSD